MKKIKKIDYSTMKYIERRRGINLQNGKILLVLVSGLIVFGPITAASYKMSFCLCIISLVISSIITSISYRAKKRKQYFTYKYSKQLWYFNIFLGMGILGGIFGLSYLYDYKIDNIVTVLFVIVLVYVVFSSQIIYYAAERKIFMYKYYINNPVIIGENIDGISLLKFIQTDINSILSNFGINIITLLLVNKKEDKMDILFLDILKTFEEIRNNIADNLEEKMTLLNVGEIRLLNNLADIYSEILDSVGGFLDDILKNMGAPEWLDNFLINSDNLSLEGILKGFVSFGFADICFMFLMQVV